MTTRLQAVHLAAADLERATKIYEVILGCAAREHGGAAQIEVGSVSIVLSPRTVGPVGLAAIDLVVDSLGDRAEGLADDGQSYTAGMGRIIVELHGVELRLSGESSGPGPSGDGSATASVDHVALRVADLEAATRRWEVATGVEAEMMGLHPVSGGAFSASRLHLGPQMIELVSPTAGVDSPMARRLASHGEGPAALAVPSTTLDETLEALAALGVTVIRSDPHWLVHPTDGCGVLVQLTPRVEH